MQLKRLIALALVAGMVAGGVGAADAAKKKKRKPKVRKIVKIVPKDQTFFLRRDDCGSTDTAAPDNPHLSVKDAVDGGTGCGSAYAGLVNEVFVNAEGAALSPTVFPAADGVPLTLDATKPLAGTITVQSFQGRSENPGGLSAGPAQLEIVVDGVSGGTAATIGTTTVDYLVTPDKNIYPVEFEIDVPDELNKKKFESLTLTLIQRGGTALHGFYELEDPGSSFKIGTLTRKIVKVRR